MEPTKARRRQQTAIKEQMRQLSVQLQLLNHRVGEQAKLRAVDVACLEIIGRHGPLSPSALARRAGLHPATMTGILDRLEGGGWIARDRDPADRRGVLVRASRERAADMYRLYSGMNASIDEICAGYTDDQLDLIADFLLRTTDAGRQAADDLAPPR
jgi:DNA-binding MarR family transcriptional regulator